MTDSHQLVEAWLAEGAIGDPPRELAVHATVCASCARRIGAFDSLAAVNVAAAGSPPPLTAPSPFWLLLARGRAATTIAATVAAGILVVFGASQLIGSIGPPEVPGPSQVAVAMTPGPDGKPVDGHGPRPGGGAASEPSDPIASFVPLPSPLTERAATGSAKRPLPGLERGRVLHRRDSVDGASCRRTGPEVGALAPDRIPAPGSSSGSSPLPCGPSLTVVSRPGRRTATAFAR